MLREEQGELEAIVIATGSEVAQAIDAAEKLSAAGRGVRVARCPAQMSLSDKMQCIERPFCQAIFWHA